MNGEGIKLVWRGILPSGDEWRMMHYYMGIGDWTSGGVIAWAGELWNAVKTAISNQVSFYGIDVAERLDVSTPSADGWNASTFVAVSHTGTNAGQPLPPADCFLILEQTGIKHVMGRKFIPGPTEDNQSGGNIDGPTTTTLDAFGAKLWNPTNKPLSGDAVACTWGTVHGFTEIKSTRTNTHLFHLRRRQKGHGI